jgi:hypothetical protein
MSYANQTQLNESFNVWASRIDLALRQGGGAASRRAALRAAAAAKQPGGEDDAQSHVKVNSSVRNLRTAGVQKSVCERWWLETRR